MRIQKHLEISNVNCISLNKCFFLASYLGLVFLFLPGFCSSCNICARPGRTQEVNKLSRINIFYQMKNKINVKSTTVRFVCLIKCKSFSFPFPNRFLKKIVSRYAFYKLFFFFLFCFLNASHSFIHLNHYLPSRLSCGTTMSACTSATQRPLLLNSGTVSIQR